MSDSLTNPGPLSGLMVVEMGSFIAGPFCGQLLGDLGADVVKIEPPSVGDAMRQWGVARKNGNTLWWKVIARNKRSLTLDLRKQAGQRVASDLLAKADILIENFRPGTLEKWGLGPEDLLQRNPGLIIGRVSGFGQTGPWSKRSGFGAIAEAVAGFRYLGGFPDRPPVRAGLSIGDSLAGLFACVGILAALNRRRQDGKGQVVDVAITDAVLAISESVLAEYSSAGVVRERAGTVLPMIAPSNVYPTADGDWVLIAGNGDAVFRRLTEAMVQPELATDPRFSSHRLRGENQQLLDKIIENWSASLKAGEILELMEAHGVPAGPVCNAADVASNAHFRARGSVVDVGTSDVGTITMQGVVPHLTQTPGAIRGLGPGLGQHNDEILAGTLGYHAEYIDALKAQGAV